MKRREKGITLIALVITIVILLILVTIGISVGNSSIKSSRFIVFTTELKMMQNKVNELNESEVSIDSIGVGTKYSNMSNEQKSALQSTEVREVLENNYGETINNDLYNKFIYLTKENIVDSLKVDGITRDFIINIEKRYIISAKSFKYEGKNYYMLEQTDNSYYNVQNKALEFSKAYGRIDVVWLDTNNNIIDKPNAPDLLGGLTPIKWDGTQFITTTSSDANWYNYSSIQGKSDNNSSQWANAINTDGSYFVWIPRYAYKITYYASEDSDIPTGYCDGNGIRRADGTLVNQLDPGIKTVKKEGTNNNYIVHPAFMDDRPSGYGYESYSHGGWDCDLSGIWVAKFEMSMETNGTPTITSDNIIGNVQTNSSIKAVSKPNVTSWRNISIGNCYTNSKNYDSTKNSHLMKNSEWGAVAYLTHSQFGRNGHEIDTNNTTQYITGNSGGSPNVDATSETTYLYNTEQGGKASSTGNIYGIYDLNGGAWECVAGFCNMDSDNNMDSYGWTDSEYINENAGKLTTSTKSYKLATKYNNSATSLDTTDIYSVGKIGDSTKEVKVASNNWFNDCGTICYRTACFNKRGGDNSRALVNPGLFASSEEKGRSESNKSFRTVLAANKTDEFLNRSGIQVGDYIDYEPTAGTYSKDKLGESFTGNEDANYNNTDLITGVLGGETKTVGKWRVLKVYENGKIDIIGDPTTYTVRFGGATGYNNGVYVMHDICKTLYSNSIHGIEARSVSLEDFENNLTQVGRNARDSYDYSGNSPQYGHTNYEKWGSAYTKRYYPNIYAKENGSGIDTQNGAVKTDGINDTAKDEIDNSTGANAYKQATTGLTTKETYYNLSINSTNYGTAYNVLYNNDTYWIASRCVGCVSGAAAFGLRLASNGFGALTMFESNKSPDDFYCCLRPVVTLNSNIQVIASNSASSSTGIPHHISW